MAKARSRRTMRNRKSRNRRGGLFGFSKEEKFKEEVKKLIKFNEMADTTATGKKQYMFDEPLYTSNFQNIYDLWTKIPKNDKKSVGEYFVKARDDILVDHSYRVEPYKRIIADLVEMETTLDSNPIMWTTVLRPPSVVRNEKEIKQKMIEEEQLSDLSTPHPVDGGGKSRRRHRRGRTLHKRRKSRKVRKTRCRRK